MRQMRIRYAVDQSTGDVVSQNLATNELAYELIDFEAMGPQDSYAIKSHLVKCGYLEWPASHWPYLTWTRKIPTELKNVHRAFWGMKPLT